MGYFGYIYLTENLVNGHKYIGQHKWSKPYIDTKYYGSGTHLLRAIKKHGKENFRVHVLQWCKNQWEMDSREIAWILMYDAVNSPEFYNMAKGGNYVCLTGENHPLYGKPRPKETRDKISKSLSGPNNPCYGKPHSPEHNRKISESNKGKNKGKSHPSKRRKR